MEFQLVCDGLAVFFDLGDTKKGGEQLLPPFI